MAMLTKPPVAESLATVGKKINQDLGYELRRVIDRAAVHFILGETQEGSALMSETMERVIALVAEQRDAPWETFTERQILIKDLVKEVGDKRLSSGLSSYESFRMNAELDYMDGNEEILAYDDASEFVDKMVAIYKMSLDAS